MSRPRSRALPLLWLATGAALLTLTGCAAWRIGSVGRAGACERAAPGRPGRGRRTPADRRRQHGRGHGCQRSGAQPGRVARERSPASAHRQPGARWRPFRRRGDPTGFARAGRTLRRGAGAGRRQRRDPPDWRPGLAGRHRTCRREGAPAQRPGHPDAGGQRRQCAVLLPAPVVVDDPAVARTAPVSCARQPSGTARFT